MTLQDIGDGTFISRTTGHDFQGLLKAKISFVKEFGFVFDVSHVTWFAPGVSEADFADYSILRRIEDGAKEAYSQWEQVIGCSFSKGIRVEVLEIKVSLTLSHPHGWKKAGSNLVKNWIGLRAFPIFSQQNHFRFHQTIDIVRACANKEYLQGLKIPVCGYLYTDNDIYLSDSSKSKSVIIKLDLQPDHPYIQRIKKLKDSSSKEIQAMAEGLLTLDQDVLLIRTISRVMLGFECSQHDG